MADRGSLPVRVVAVWTVVFVVGVALYVATRSPSAPPPPRDPLRLNVSTAAAVALPVELNLSNDDPVRVYWGAARQLPTRVVLYDPAWRDPAALDGPLRLPTAAPGTDLFLDAVGHVRLRTDPGRCVPADVCRRLYGVGEPLWDDRWPRLGCMFTEGDWLGFQCVVRATARAVARCPRWRDLDGVAAECAPLDPVCPRVAPFRPLQSHQLADLSTAPHALAFPRDNWTAADVTHLQVHLYNMPRWLGPADVHVTSVHGINLVGGTYDNGSLAYPDGLPLWAATDRCVCLPLAHVPTDHDLAFTSLRTSRHAGGEWRPVAANLSWHTAACPCTCPELDQVVTTTTTTTTAAPATTTPAPPTPLPSGVCTIQQLSGKVNLISAVYTQQSTDAHTSFGTMAAADAVAMQQANLAAANKVTTTVIDARGHVLRTATVGQDGDPGYFTPGTSDDWYVQTYASAVYDTGVNRYCFNTTDASLIPFCSEYPSDGWDRAFITVKHNVIPAIIGGPNADTIKTLFDTFTAQPLYVSDINVPRSLTFSQLAWPGGTHGFPPTVPVDPYFNSTYIALPANKRLVLNISLVGTTWNALRGYVLTLRAPAASNSFGKLENRVWCRTDYEAGKHFVARTTSVLTDHVAYAVSRNCSLLGNLPLAQSPSLVQQLLHGDLSGECGGPGYPDCSVHEL